MKLKGISVVLSAAMAFLPIYSFGFGTATPTTITNLHWVISGSPQFTTCTELTDIHLDVISSRTAILPASGYATCNTASGALNLAVIGNVLNTVSGFGVSLYMDDYRLFCVLSDSTLSSSSCVLFNISSGAQAAIFSMFYTVP